jgi:hypothetical protein
VRLADLLHRVDELSHAAVLPFWFARLLATHPRQMIRLVLAPLCRAHRRQTGTAAAALLSRQRQHRPCIGRGLCAAGLFRVIGAGRVGRRSSVRCRAAGCIRSGADRLFDAGDAARQVGPYGGGAHLFAPQFRGPKTALPAERHHCSSRKLPVTVGKLWARHGQGPCYRPSRRDLRP